MARPKKNTVDYFPHDCHWSKELEIFIHEHGNEGYAFYYRLLELLGVTPDHKYDCSKSINYQYLISKTKVDEKKLDVYIECLVSIGVINEELWEDKIIWIQSFVDSIEDVYARRTTDLPSIDSFRGENTTFRSRNPQSKGKETKRKESGVKNAPRTNIPQWVEKIGKQYPKVDVNYSFLRYKNYRKDNVDEQGFLSWVMEDDREGRNLKKKEIQTHTTLYCVKCDFFNQVPSNKTFSHLCEECGDQMVEKHELAAFRNKLIKERQ